MNPEPAWPSSASELVLWIEVVSIWIIASYVIARDVQSKGQAPSSGPLDGRAFLAIAVVGSSGWLLPPPGTSAFIQLSLSALLVLAMTTNVLVRRKPAIQHLHRLAEWEIGTCVVVALASATIIGFGQIGAAPGGSLLRSGKFAAALSVVAAIVFVFRGGTYIVRGVLDKANAIPQRAAGSASDAAANATDVQELNRGRAIGNLERLLMLMAIGLGSYEALGFLVAAKGLIRAHEFENRDFAEYFILGSLASVAVAFVAGALLRVSLIYLWTLP
jgi:hypothetical protein